VKTIKTCFDCLYCKVSSKSTKNCRLCFCSQTDTKVRHRELYWLNKKTCDGFVDMTEKTLLVFHKTIPATNKRKPLLRNKAYEG